MEVQYKEKILATVENIKKEEEPLKKKDCKCEYELICY